MGVRRGELTRPGPSSPAEASSSRRTPAPALNFSGLRSRREGPGVVGSQRRLLFPGWGTGASGTRMLAKPAVSGAPTGPGPARPRGGGAEGDPDGLPFSSQYHPLKTVSPSSAARAGNGEETSEWARSWEKPPASLSSDPRGFAPTAASFPRGEGAAGKSGRSQLGEALIQ